MHSLFGLEFFAPLIGWGDTSTRRAVAQQGPVTELDRCIEIWVNEGGGGEEADATSAPGSLRPKNHEADARLF